MKSKDVLRIGRWLLILFLPIILVCLLAIPNGNSEMGYPLCNVIILYAGTTAKALGVLFGLIPVVKFILGLFKKRFRWMPLLMLAAVALVYFAIPALLKAGIPECFRFETNPPL